MQKGKILFTISSRMEANHTSSLNRACFVFKLSPRGCNQQYSEHPHLLHMDLQEDRIPP